MSAPGPLGEEARLLVEAARDWAARTFPGTDRHLADGSTECCWCPVCRTVSALRDPEVADRVVDRITGVVTAAAGGLAAVLETLSTPDREPAPDPPAGPAGTPSGPFGTPSGPVGTSAGPFGTSAGPVGTPADGPGTTPVGDPTTIPMDTVTDED